MKFYCLLIILISTPACSNFSQFTRDKGIWSTNYDGLKIVDKIDSVNFKPGRGKKKFTVHVSESIKYQSIDGFGAALTDSSAWLLANKMDPNKKMELLHALFSPSEIGLNIIRLPIGASDFSLKPHTYNDLDEGQEDIDQAKFSIKYDLSYIIPIIKLIKKINPNLRIVASPWSPPAWMKTKYTLNGGQLKKEYFSSYARYLTNFILHYRRQGIFIDVMTVQNEPNYQTKDYPSMLMSPDEQAAIVSKLIPLFKKFAITTKIFVWDHNWSQTKSVFKILGNDSAGPYISGTAWHAYEGNAKVQTIIHNKFPNKKIYFTEVTGMEAYKNFDHNLYWSVKNVIIDGLRNWAEAILYWNIVLDDSHGPNIKPLTLDDTKVLRGLVQYDRKSKRYDLQTELYALAHLSQFIKPGARRIYSETFSGGKMVLPSSKQKAKGIPYSVALQNPDGSKVLLILNTGFRANIKFDILWNGQYLTQSLERESVMTLVW